LEELFKGSVLWKLNPKLLFMQAIKLSLLVLILIQLGNESVAQSESNYDYFERGFKESKRRSKGAQKNVNYSYLDKKWYEWVKTGELPIPPGGVFLKRNTFIDQSEMANIHWLEFLFYVGREDSSQALLNKTYVYELEDEFIQKNDSVYGILEVWKNSSWFAENYPQYPGFRYYPLVGVTYQQAINYCKWRSEMASENVNLELKYLGFDKRIYFHYRLPTEKEFELAVSKFAKAELRNFDKQDFRNLKSKNFNIRKKELFEYKIPSVVCEYNLPKTHFSASDKIEGFNFLGWTTENARGKEVYNLLGNVAEMTAEIGLAKGGSWKNSFEKCNANNDFQYECPTEWLGFRCVADVFVYHKDSTFTKPQLPEAIETCSWVLERDSLQKNP
jgi:formylglycine-generating enzyme required for sulfatase activity